MSSSGLNKIDNQVGLIVENQSRDINAQAKIFLPFTIGIHTWCTRSTASPQQAGVIHVPREGQQGPGLQPNKFLVEVIKGRKPEKALDIGIGEGRNAFFLASQGWEVTGFDISDVGIKHEREETQKRGLKLNIVVDDVDRFDFGEQRWDLVVGMYMHDLITRNAGKIIESLKPGGIIVIEGFHRDVNIKNMSGGALGYQSNEFLKVFDRLRVLHYMDRVGEADWGNSTQQFPILQFIALKKPSPGD